ncbi:bifunctional UDP-N-acetylglucosamine 2-epimerase/N-acetylmannosamine kinase-like [Glandiceps talaboti]
MTTHLVKSDERSERTYTIQSSAMEPAATDTKCRPLRVCVATSNRADYSKLSPLMIGLRDDPDFELQVIVNGCHLLDEYGSTVKVIKDDGININWKMHTIVQGGDEAAMVESMSLSLSKLPDILLHLQPDFLVVHGDRFDALGLATAAALMNIRIVHVEGGEVSGTIDDSIRHAITKLAHYHICCTETSKHRLIAMCEEEKRIVMSGCPVYDKLLRMDTATSRSDVIEKWLGKGVNPNDYVICLQHPVTTEIDHSVKMLRYAIDALIEFGKKTLVLYPNVDAGSHEMMNILHQSRLKDNPNFVTARHVPFVEFITLMANCGVLIGNSSCCVRETCAFGTPVVSLGSRQAGRERIENVLNCKDADSMHTVLHALQTQYQKKCPRSHLYGDGNAVDRILDFLRNIDITERLQKSYNFPTIPVSRNTHRDIDQVVNKQAVLSVSIEGAMIKTGLVNEKGNVIHSFPDDEIKQESTLSDIKTVIKKKIHSSDSLQAQVTAISIGINTESLKTLRKTNLQNGHSEKTLEDALTSDYNLPVYVNSNVDCIAKAEKLYGLGKHYDNFLVINIGKGDIESALMVNGRSPTPTPSGQSVDLAHMTVTMNGRLCSCGNHGCVNAYSSALSLSEQTKAFLQGERFNFDHDMNSNVNIYIDHLKNGSDLNNHQIQTIVQTGMEALVCGISNVMKVVDVQLIILNGNLVPLYINGIVEALMKKSPNIKVERSKLDNVVLLGAAAMVICLERRKIA